MNLSQYTKFFNYGYFLSKFEPKFLKKLIASTNGVEEINDPLKAGKAQFGREQVLDRLKSLPKNIKSERNKEKGIEPYM